MVGFIYRRAIAIKEFGERHRIAFLIRLGLALRAGVGKYPVHQGVKIKWFGKMLCDIGRDPKPFLAGVLSTLFGLFLGFTLLIIF